MASAQDQKFKVNVKWSKELLKDVELDTSESPQVFKMQLWTLTGVPPERQTVLGLRGGKLKDDADWSKTGIKPNMTLMLMGTPGDSLKAPPAKLPKVRDDLNATAEDEMNFDAAPSHPPGLVNMGNTCYMNATVQCLNTVQPLRHALQQYRGSTTALNPDEKLSASLRDLVSRMGSGNASKIDPTSFLTTLRQVNPQFAERGRNHFYMQQDAEECWGEILSRLAAALKPAELKIDSGESEAAASNSNGASNRIDELFGIEVISTDKCEEDETEQPIERKESIRVLKCHISLAVNHLSQGIAEGLEDVIEKNSENLGRTAKWKRTSRLNKIPPFLIVQFVRFFWKPTEAVKAKILRNVSFPVQLDLYDFCTEELKQKLSEKRSLQAPAPGEDKDRPKPSASSSTAGTSEMVVEASASTGAPSQDNSASTPVQAEAGNYELCAVLTHKGRAADAGHYVAWVKDSGSRWYKFDDDKVFVQTEDDVKKLSGGGDWHMAYMCVYRAKNTF